MARPDIPSGADFPARLFVLAVVLTGGAVGWLGWTAWSSSLLSESLLARADRLQELREEIVAAQERLETVPAVVSGSADGDSKRRQGEIERRLAGALEEAMRLAHAALPVGIGADRAALVAGRLSERVEPRAALAMVAMKRDELAASSERERLRARSHVLGSIGVLGVLGFAWLALTRNLGGCRTVLLEEVRRRTNIADTLRENQRRLLTLMENLPGLVYRCRNDPERKMEFVSDGCLEITGYYAAELARDGGVPYGDLVHPRDRARIWSEIEDRLAEREPFRVMYRIRHRSGEDRWVWEQGRGISAADGSLTAIEGVVLDITESQRTKGELARARRAAFESARLKAAFLSNISHEIRTPLGLIEGYLETIVSQLEGLGESNGEHALERIRTAGVRLTRTVEDVLDLSKFESGSFEVYPEPILLGPLVERVARDFDPAAHRKGLSLSCAVEEAGTSVLFDEYCLSRSLGNLLDNALKFTSSGSVSIRLFRDPAGTLSIEVRDTGVGVSAEYLPRLFEAFSQEESDPARRFEGLGVGLALAQRYLERNGARLTAESVRGRGSVFTVALPRERELGGPRSAPPVEAA